MERFKEKYEERGPEECWPWTSTLTNGHFHYGKFHYTKEEGVYRQGLAHRLALSLRGVDVPDDMEVDHLCKNVICVNPKHLEVVTKYENLRRSDSPSSINARKTHCPAGHSFAEHAYIYPNGKRKRCRTCNVSGAREFRRRKKEGTS